MPPTGLPHQEVLRYLPCDQLDAGRDNKGTQPGPCLREASSTVMLQPPAGYGVLDGAGQQQSECPGEEESPRAGKVQRAEVRMGTRGVRRVRAVGSEVGNEDLREYGKKGSNFSNIYFLFYLLNSLPLNPLNAHLSRNMLNFF